ncbi:MAG: CRISPR-associated endonuclease Cas2 [Planctomycetia bacterium]|nr:CRISPR-associated endonuclease Cas2 [Planctomycetia bacterium]
MLLVSYDISNDKKRTQFSRFLQKFGHRIQYSVFEIENSTSILNNIVTEIETKFLKKFDQSDSIYLFQMSSSCIIHKFGYAENEDDTLIVI